MQTQNNSLIGTLSIFLASFLWGTTGTAASFTPTVSPLATGAFAMGGAGLLLVIYSYSAISTNIDKLIKNPKLLFLGALSVVVYPLAFYSSMRLSGVAVGTVVSIASAPFFAALIERLISNKKVDPLWALAYLIGAIGICLLALGKNDISVSSSSNQVLGIGLGLIAGLTYTGYSWAAKQLISKKIQPKSAMASIFGLAACVLLPSLLITGDNLFASKTNTLVAFYMAIVPMFLGYLLFGFGLKYTDTSHALLLTLLEPVIAIFLAILIVKENFSLIGWLGILLIGFCLLLQVIQPNIRQSNGHSTDNNKGQQVLS